MCICSKIYANALSLVILSNPSSLAMIVQDLLFTISSVPMSMYCEQHVRALEHGLWEPPGQSLLSPAPVPHFSLESAW